MTQPDISYPVQFSVDFPDRPLDRLSSVFRPLVSIPVGVVLSLLQEAAGGLLFGPLLLLILFRRKYPRWWVDWSVALLWFENRVFAYLFPMVALIRAREHTVA